MALSPAREREKRRLHDDDDDDDDVEKLKKRHRNGSPVPSSHSGARTASSFCGFNLWSDFNA